MKTCTVCSATSGIACILKERSPSTLVCRLLAVTHRSLNCIPADDGNQLCSVELIELQAKQKAARVWKALKARFGTT